MDCKNCTERNTEPVSVPFFAVEGTNYRTNKTMRWMAVVFIVSLLVIATVIGLCGLLVYRTNRQCIEKVEAINQHWLDYLSEYDFSGESYEYSQDGRGINIMGDNNGVDYDGNGVIDDGTTSESNSEETNQEER
jgi:hypothetical protein